MYESQMNPLGHEMTGNELLVGEQPAAGSEVYFSTTHPNMPRFGPHGTPAIAPSAEYHGPSHAFYSIPPEYAEQQYRLPPFESLHHSHEHYGYPQSFEIPPTTETPHTETNSTEEAAIQEYLEESVISDYTRAVNPAFI
jgi:hypothetical protein